MKKFKNIFRIILNTIGVMTIIGFAYIWLRIEHAKWFDVYLVKVNTQLTIIFTLILITVFLLKRNFIRGATLIYILYKYIPKFNDAISRVNSLQDGSYSFQYTKYRNKFILTSESYITSFISLVLLTLLALTLIYYIVDIIRKSAIVPTKAVYSKSSDFGISQNSNHHDKENYDSLGYDRDGYDRLGYDRYGYDRYGYDHQGRDCLGRDRNGYDFLGYDYQGRDRDGYDIYGQDKDGYNKDGYDSLGRDRDGFDKDGYDSMGYDANGYDRNGYNPQDINSW